MQDHNHDSDEKVNQDRKVRAREKENQKGLTQDHDLRVDPDRREFPNQYNNGEDPTDHLVLKEIDLHQFAFDVSKRALKRKLHQCSNREKSKSHRRCRRNY